jgi:MFS family permease
MSLVAVHKKNKVFYGWYILAASFIILFLTSGIRFSIGVVFKPRMFEFGWNRSSISLAFFVNMTIYAFFLIIAGRAFDRYGPKWVIAVSAVFLSAGFMGIAFIETLWQFFIFYGILAGIGMGGTTVPLFAALITKWFNKHQGLAVSLGLAGSCAGQFILVPAFTFFILQYGWRTSYFVVSLIMLVVILLLGLFVIKGDPKDLGLKPFGHKEENKDKVKSSEQQPVDTVSLDFSLLEAMKTHSFWLFIVVNFTCGSGDFLVATHLIPMVTDYGISPTIAGNMLAWMGLMSLAGILIAGPLSDIIGTRIPFAATFLIRCLLFLMILKYQNTVSFYILSLGFGFTLLAGAPLTPILIGKMYGLSNLGLITGVVVTVHHIAGGFWAYVGGLIFDQTGSYLPAFTISTGMALAAFFAMMLIKEIKHLR